MNMSIKPEEIKCQFVCRLTKNGKFQTGMRRWRKSFVSLTIFETKIKWKGKQKCVFFLIPYIWWCHSFISWNSTNYMNLTGERWWSILVPNVQYSAFFFFSFFFMFYFSFSITMCCLKSMLCSVSYLNDISL